MVSSVLSTGALAEEHFDYDDIGRLIRAIDEQGHITTYNYDSLGNILSVVTDGAAQTPPTVSSVDPNFIRAGETKRIRISGSQLAGANVGSGDSRIQTSTVSASDTELVINVTASSDAIPGPRTFSVSNIVGTATLAITLRPTMSVTTVPSYIAIPPDSSSRVVTVRLSDGDTVPLAFTIDTMDSTIASVAPTSITLAPGQTEFQLTMVGKRVAKTALRVFSSTLALPAVFVVYVTNDTVNRSSPVGVLLPVPSSNDVALSGADLGVYVPAPPDPSPISVEGADVGVFLASTTGNGATQLESSDLGVWVSASQALAAVNNLQAMSVGVAFGLPQVMALSPSSATGGTTMTLIIRGSNLFDASAVTAEPSDGITFTSAPIATPDGTRITVDLSIAPGTAAGPRVIRVTSPAGTSAASAVAGNTFTVN